MIVCQFQAYVKNAYNLQFFFDDRPPFGDPRSPETAGARTAPAWFDFSGYSRIRACPRENPWHIHAQSNGVNKVLWKLIYGFKSTTTLFHFTHFSTTTSTSIMCHVHFANVKIKQYKSGSSLFCKMQSPVHCLNLLLPPKKITDYKLRNNNCNYVLHQCSLDVFKRSYVNWSIFSL